MAGPLTMPVASVACQVSWPISKSFTLEFVQELAVSWAVLAWYRCEVSRTIMAREGPEGLVR